MSPRNIAFVDGQNLHLGVHSENRHVDFKKFRIYLEKKYHVHEAFYFLGFLDEGEQDLYTSLQRAGFILVFREHNANMKGEKKGNVDADIVFEIMRQFKDNGEDFDKFVLVSGDGDYIKLVKYLIKHDRFTKLLVPNSHYSSLYKPLIAQYGVNLSLPDIRKKIEYQKRGALR